jgi:hypothetical protein
MNLVIPKGTWLESKWNHASYRTLEDGEPITFHTGTTEPVRAKVLAGLQVNEKGYAKGVVLLCNGAMAQELMIAQWEYHSVDPDFAARVLWVLTERPGDKDRIPF